MNNFLKGCQFIPQAKAWGFLDIVSVKDNILFIQIGSLVDPLKENKIDEITMKSFALLEANDFSTSILKGICLHHFVSIEAYKV